MGGRGASSGGGAGSSPVKSLIAQGGKRWQKNGKDRIYLDKAMSRDLDMSAPDAPFSMSRAVEREVGKTVSSAYYDVNEKKLFYTKSRYDWANSHVEREFKRLIKRKK